METVVTPEEKAKVVGKELALVFENTIEDRVQLLRQIMEYKEAKRAGRNVRLVARSNDN